jgi:hypothetical protein
VPLDGQHPFAVRVDFLHAVDEMVVIAGRIANPIMRVHRTDAEKDLEKEECDG